MPHSPAYNRALASGSCSYVYAVELSIIPDSRPGDRQAATALISVVLRLSESGIQIQAKEPRSREGRGSPHNLIDHLEKIQHTRNSFPTRHLPNLSPRDRMVFILPVPANYHTALSLSICNYQPSHLLHSSNTLVVLPPQPTHPSN
jgi:hypothetical protein